MSSFSDRSKEYQQKMAIETQAEVAEIAKLPQDKKDGLLLGAVREDRPGQIEKLLSGGASIDAHDPKTGMTGLMIALENDRPLLVDFLMEKGANPNAKANNGMSVIEIGIRAAAKLFNDFDEDSDRYTTVARVAENPAFDTSTTIKWQGMNKTIEQYARIIGAVPVSDALETRKAAAAARTDEYGREISSQETAPKTVASAPAAESAAPGTQEHQRALNTVIAPKPKA